MQYIIICDFLIGKGVIKALLLSCV